MRLEKAFKTTFHKRVHFILAYIFAIFRPPGRAGRPLIKDYQRTEEHKGCLYQYGNQDLQKPNTVPVTFLSYLSTSAGIS